MTQWQYKADRKMHAYGDTDDKKKRIRINPSKGDVVNTILHEEAHKLYPKKNEKQVRKIAAKKEKKMSLPEMANLIKRMAKKIKRT